MSDNFTAERFRWLEQINSDHHLPALASKVGFWISSHVNRIKLYAYPSQETLAREAGCSRKGLQLSIEALVKNGHLQSEVHRGRKQTNKYRWVLKPVQNANQVTHLDDENANPSTQLEADNANLVRIIPQKMRTPVRISRKENANPSTH